MFLKANRRNKDGKTHTYYTLNESLRVGRWRTIQRCVLHLGELNTTQVERWQHTIETVHEDGKRHQMRLFTDREHSAPVAQEDAAEVILSSLLIRRPREFGAGWVGCKLWEELGLREFWDGALGLESGQVSWARVVELLAVNRLCEPASELSIHEKWFPRTAMDVLLDCDAAVAEKDRLYRCLDRMVEHKEALETHLTERWRDLFGARFDVLLYDLTSTYFEGEVEEVKQAKRGYSRDSRADCKQIVIALIVTPEGFPLSYEVFDGNRVDVTTLDEVLDSVEKKYGKANRTWIFDRGIVSEENLESLHKRGGSYLVGTPRHQLKNYQEKLLNGDWHKLSENVQVQLMSVQEETYVLAKSNRRAEKEKAMRWRVIRGLMGDLIKLRRSLRIGRIKNPARLERRLGRLEERYPQAHAYVQITVEGLQLSWEWNREKLKLAQARDGAYLLRTNLKETDPAKLWCQYIQLMEAEAAFRALKSDVAIRPIWHWVQKRVQAHVMVAFLGYALWVTLKNKLRRFAQSLTPRQVLEQFKRIQLVEVWFKLQKGGAICLPRITQPETVQAVILDQLGWKLPQQPPPKIYQHQIPNVWETFMPK